MAFASFCGLLTLQVGCAVVSTVFFVIAALSFGVNVFDYTQHPDNSWPVDMFIICIFVVLMVLAGILIFLAAYNESRRTCLVALGVIVLTLMYWIILTIFSLVNQPTDVRRVCAQDRCGATFWLASLKYRTRPEVTDFQTTEDTPHTDYTDEDTTDIPDYSEGTFPPFEPGTQPTEQTDEPTDKPYDDTTTTEPAQTIKTLPPITSKKDQASLTTTTELSPASSTESITAAPKRATEEITTIPKPTPDVPKPTPDVPKPTPDVPKPTLPPPTPEPTVAPGRKKRLLDNKQVFNNKDETTVTSFDKTAYPMWYQPFLKMLKEEKSKNLLTSLSDMDSDDYESGDEDNSGTEETDEKEETDPTEDGEEEESDTESSQITYGSAFVGAIIFSLVNLLFFVFAIITVWSYAQELKWGSYYYNSQTRSYN